MLSFPPCPSSRRPPAPTASPSSPPSSPARQPSFSALRLATRHRGAELAVTHASLLAGANTGAWYGRFTARLDVGVTVFFLISGFLLYRRLLRGRAASRCRSAGPPHWLALTVLSIYPGLPQM
jgi:peptidoglycan/LPS O-acetylase OafA/YrhL